MNYKKIIYPLALVFVIITGATVTQDYFEVSKNLDIFNTVYREINAAYVEETKPGQLMKTGIDAMLSTLDPYTIYFTENDIEDYRFMLTGEYGGIGANINDINGKITIVEVLEGFAAHKAGLRAGDHIVGVNGIGVEGKSTVQISSLLNGQAGTPIKLKVIQVGKNAAVDMDFIREEIKLKSVSYSGLLEDKKTGYIKLTAFTDNCGQEVKKAFQELKSNGCTRLMLDLRGNPGGLLHEAVNVVNIFVNKGLEVVYTKGRTSDWDKSYLSVNNPVDTQIPLVVLVDEYSASASEIVSGALQDLDRAVVLGRRTFGKGLVQQTRDLVYNAKIKVTVAKYYIPSGRCVQALDYTHKDEEGRVEKVPDSLVTAFKTKGGRIVYDGAGVTPDITTMEERPSNILNALENKSHIFNFVTQFYLKNPQISGAREFALKEQDYSLFLDYLKDKNYSYTSKSDRVLVDLKNNLEEEAYISNVKTEIETLESKLESYKKAGLQKYKQQIMAALEEEIISRYYFQKGITEYNLSRDPDILKASELLKNEAEISTILTRIDKPVKPFNAKKRF